MNEFRTLNACICFHLKVIELCLVSQPYSDGGLSAPTVFEQTYTSIGFISSRKFIH